MSRNITRCFGTLVAAALLSAVACQKEPVRFQVGEDRVVPETLEQSSVMLKGMTAYGNVSRSLLTEGGPSAVQEIYAAASTPLTVDQTVVVEVDTSLVAGYSAETGIDYQILPAPFYEMENHGVTVIRAGKPASEALHVKIYATNPLGNRLAAGRYLLPLRLKATAQQAADKVHYLAVNVRSPFKGNAPLYTGEDAFFVFYINTAEYDPRLVTDYLIDKDGPDPEKCWYCTVGNLINLRKATVGYEKSTGRAQFDLGSDLRYLLNHYDTYILPLQEEGRKVCLTLEGGGLGLGFSNLTDEQISDFVAQVRLVMDTFPLDGISLWDRGAAYDKSVERGFPETNTTSYPKLIRALKEMLGPDRLLTLADEGKPTESFWDKETCGSIEVGKYLDYAWSGYCDAGEGPLVIDPYHQGADGVSDLHPRKPISGLDESRYGCVNYPWRPPTAQWENTYMEILGYTINKSKPIIVLEDLRTNLQDSMEMSWVDSFMSSIPKDNLLSGGEYIYLFDKSQLSHMLGGFGYNKWIKDW